MSPKNSKFHKNLILSKKRYFEKNDILSQKWKFKSEIKKPFLVTRVEQQIQCPKNVNFCQNDHFYDADVMLIQIGQNNRGCIRKMFPFPTSEIRNFQSSSKFENFEKNFFVSVFYEIETG